VVGGFRTTISTSEIRIASKRIEVEENNRKAAQEKRVTAADSLQKFQFQILELENNTEVAGELGPLQYLSGLTEIPMDKIINILLLVIIFVFDPLAIALVVAANFAFDQAYRRNLYGELENDVPIVVDQSKPDLEPKGMNFVDNDDEIESYMDLNVEVETPDAPINKEEEVEAPVEVKEEEWKTLNEDDSEITERKQVKKILQKAPTRQRVLFTDGTAGWISNDNIDRNDDNKITYM
jgi:hypothetical protein